jgi:hypothetical protein
VLRVSHSVLSYSVTDRLVRCRLQMNE